MQNQKTSVDATFLRKMNKRLILDAIFTRRITSRAELSKALKLSKPAISDNLAELLTLGIIEEAGEGKAARSGGRRPQLLRFNPNHRYIVSLDLSYSSPIAVLGNLGNEILAETDIPLLQNRSPEQYVASVIDAIDRLLPDGQSKADGLYCIAVSSPGVYDADGGVVAQNPGYSRVLWHESHLRETLLARYGTKLIVKNDIKAATLGEWTHGAGQGEENLLYVSCGVGLGAGLVLNGSLFEGSRFNAGEIYYYLDKQGLSAAQTLEDRISMKRLLETCEDDIKAGVQTSLSQIVGPLVFEDVMTAYQSKDPYIRQLIEGIAQELGTLIFNLGNFLGLDKVIFGGEYAVFGDTLTAVYENRFKPRLHTGAGIHLAALGKTSSVHGLLFTARECYFGEICG